MKKEVKLKELKLRSFKGIKSLDITFDGNTNIFGKNGVGKTTIFDAFVWLLFGKDHLDRKDVQFKTLDKNNNVIHKLEHIVEAVLEVNGTELLLKKILKEKWTKKKGALTSELTGNVTDHYWDEVPVKKNEWDSKINELIDEKVFKLLTNPFAFDSLKWQDRRSVLIDIVGGVSDEEIAERNSEYQNLVSKLSKGKDLEAYRKQIQASIKKAKDDLKMIPTRIDEVERGKPEGLNFDQLRRELTSKENFLASVNEQLEDAAKAFQIKLDAVREQKVKINNLKTDIKIVEDNTLKRATEQCRPDTSVKDSLVAQKSAKESDLSSYKSGLSRLENKLEELKKDISNRDIFIQRKRDEWTTENSKEATFADHILACPTCKRAFEEADVEEKKAEIVANFKRNKAEILARINKEGKELASEKAAFEEELKTIQSRVEDGKKTIQDLELEIKEIDQKILGIEAPETKDPQEVYTEILKSDSDYKNMLEELKGLEESLVEPEKSDNKELIEKRQELTKAIEQIKLELSTEIVIDSANKRIKELEDEENKLVQQIADVEREEFVIENFIKDKINFLESKINKKFSFVQFKMFDHQINGGISETCEALIDGVPFSIANTASRINAGLDIITTLSEYYGVVAPIFIDNRESVTDIINTEAQIINLIVSPQDEKLRIESTNLQTELA